MGSIFDSFGKSSEIDTLSVVAQAVRYAADSVPPKLKKLNVAEPSHFCANSGCLGFDS